MAPLTEEEEDIWGMMAGMGEEEEEGTTGVTDSAVLAAAGGGQASGGGGGATVVPLGKDPGSCCQQNSSSSPCCQQKPAAAETAPSCAGDAQAPRIASWYVGTPAGRIPAEILENEELNAAIRAGLPWTHNFEVHKSVHRLRRDKARHVGVHLPDGLCQWATVLADIFMRFVPSVETSTILGDMTFGACCIDDLGARAVGVDFLIHYGHSCIVPTDQTTVQTLYVHVEVDVDVEHLVETVRLNFRPEQKLVFMGSVQFTGGTMQAVETLNKEFFADNKVGTVSQVKPLGLGEVLGCTSPIVRGADAVVFVCDGRFHLESAMIQNPHVKGGFYRYDPAEQTLTREGFAHNEMHEVRRGVIEKAKGAQCIGLVLGTLGRQGSSGVLEGVERLLVQKGIEHFTILLSDVSPERLARFDTVDAWVQVACPRLSLDWGEAYEKPLLTPYEAHVAWGGVAYKDVYPMDYYSNRGGPWSNYGAHNGHGGSLGTKFKHLRKGQVAVEYEDNPV